MILQRNDLDRLEMVLSRAWQMRGTEREDYLDRCLGAESHLRRQAAALVAADRVSEGVWDEMPRFTPALAEEELAPEPPPSFVGPYRLETLLGEGGMGSVFRAVRSDDEYRQEVAVKLLRKENVTADLIQRFRRERQILAALNHPNIARLLDGGTSDEGLPFLVMELVRGEPIDVFCDRGRLDLHARLQLVRTVCEGVQAAHQNLVVHRDLKPSNILVTEVGKPMLLDFGIAKILNPSFAFGSRAATTKVWNRVLTPDYASPEQIRDGVVGVTSDVYSIGVILYELLTGLLPKRSHHSVSETDLTLAAHDIVLPSEGIRKLLRRDSERARALAAARGCRAESLWRYLAGDLDRIVSKALHPVPKMRYPSVDRLAEDLQRFEDGLPVLAQEPAWSYRAATFLRRNRGKVAATAAVCLGLIVTVCGLVVQARELGQERDLARLERDKAREISNFLEGLFAISDPFGLATSKGETVSRQAAEEVLELGARKVQRELVDRPELRAAILNRIGRTFGTLGYGDRAEELLRSALETREARLGPDHPDTAESLSDLAAVLRYNDSAASAEPLFERAIAIRETALGPSLELARSLRGLAKVVNALGRSREAKVRAKEAWDMSRRAAEPTHPEVLDSLVVYASMLAGGGELWQAETLLREGMRILEGLQGPQQMYRAFFVHQLAVVLHQGGDPAAAEPLFRRSVDSFEVMFGDPSGILASAIGNLGIVVRDQGRFAEAEELLRRSLEGVRAVYGASHPKVAGRLNNLAGLEMRRENPEKAEILYEQAIAAAHESLPEGHPLWAHLLAGAGYSKVLQGRPGEGENELRRAVELLQRDRGAADWLTAYYRLSLGHSLLRQGKVDEAEPLIIRAQELILENRPKGLIERRRSLEILIELYRHKADEPRVLEFQAALEAEVSPEPQPRGQVVSPS